MERNEMISRLTNLADIVIKNNKKINNEVIKKVVMAYIEYSEGKINLEELYESVKFVFGDVKKPRKPQPIDKCNYDENKLKEIAIIIKNKYFNEVDKVKSGEANNEYEQK